MASKFRHKRSLGHPRLGVDFQNHEPPRPARRNVIPEIRPAYAATTERPMRPERQLLNILVNISFKFRRKDVDGTALCIFCVIVLPAPVRSAYLYDIIGFLADDGAGQLAPGDVAFDQDLVSMGPIFIG